MLSYNTSYTACNTLYNRTIRVLFFPPNVLANLVGFRLVWFALPVGALVTAACPSCAARVGPRAGVERGVPAAGAGDGWQRAGHPARAGGGRLRRGGVRRPRRLLPAAPLPGGARPGTPGTVGGRGPR
eukprot:1877633-Pyramimonas_sp.AAC.2